jgi:tetratricopeptide (TPR) repeat protein
MQETHLDGIKLTLSVSTTILRYDRFRAGKLSQHGGAVPSDLCFVLMPFGKKPDVSGTLVDFDAVYRDLIAPAIRAAGLDPIRADEEMTGGIIHKPMFERLIFCKFAVADLTTANANVFYELGLRHAVRPWSTVLIFSKGGSQLPFDVAPLRAMPYILSSDGAPTEVEATKQALSKRLAEAREAAAKEVPTDSPIYQLVDGYPEIDHTRTDVFRDRVQYSEEQKKKLAAARKQGVAALRAIEKELGDLASVESGVVIDLFLSYRSVKAWDDMIGLVERMPRPLAATVMAQEQLGFALNRAGKGEEAEKVLQDLIEARGPSSETFGILGRVYKDRWEAAAEAGKSMQARGLLDKAVDAYLKGFEADWRDAYPGINAVTLMELKEPPDPRRLGILPVVSYAVERKIAAGKPDYWDYATRLELAVLGKDEQKAAQALGDALAVVREVWEPETTLRNLRLIREARERRGEDVPWAKEAEEELAAWGK